MRISQFLGIQRLFPVIVYISQSISFGGADGVAPSTSPIVFKYEHYDADSGALFVPPGGRPPDYDNLVHTVFVDSKGQVWVGTEMGLSIYDGTNWTGRTFEEKGHSAAEAARFGKCGPDHIAEGPVGTIWLAGRFGIWRYRDNKFEEMTANYNSAIAMAVDLGGALWVVEKTRVLKYDGRNWSSALCPYIGYPRSVEAPLLYGIVVETNGNVWIGSTSYGKLTEPWEHQGPSWVVDEAKKKRNGGPPLAPLFKFDGKGWRAFGSPHGLDVRSAWPQLDGKERLVVDTRKGIDKLYYLHQNGTWKPSSESDVLAGKQWVLRPYRIGYAELLFWDGKRHIEVRATDHRTGNVLDLHSEGYTSLRMYEDHHRGCVWLGSIFHGLYRIRPEK